MAITIVYAPNRLLGRSLGQQMKEMENVTGAHYHTQAQRQKEDADECEQLHILSQLR